MKETRTGGASPIVEVRNLRKTYGAVVAVEDLSFGIGVGEIFGIVGPNGAGKTTTVECLLGLRTPDRGSLCVLGLDPRRHARELRRRTGVQLQQAALPDDMKVWEALSLFGSLYPRCVDRQVLLDTWGLREKRTARYASLSGGQRQRLFIALSLVNDPEIVFLDELTSGLDPQARRGTWEMIVALRDAGKTVVLVTHSMEEAQKLCNRVAIIDRGRLIALDTPQRLINGLNAETRVCFTLGGGLMPSVLSGLPGVTRVERRGVEVIVSGRGPLLSRVASSLAGEGIIPADLRGEQASLEDVFLALTGHGMRE